jgi:hypothetical protein
VFLVNSRPRLATATLLGFRSGKPSVHLSRAHLLPKLRCQLAEFLNQGSLKRLRILSPPTCVGLRYGHSVDSLRGFSRKHGVGQSAFPEGFASHHLSGLAMPWICLGHPPTGLAWHFQSPVGLPFSVPPSLKRQPGGTGILTCFPSPTPFGLGLGPD